jgi:hypothetical protein
VTTAWIDSALTSRASPGGRRAVALLRNLDTAEEPFRTPACAR